MTFPGGCTPPSTGPAGRWPGRPGSGLAPARSTRVRLPVTRGGRRDSAHAPGRASSVLVSFRCSWKPCCASDAGQKTVEALDVLECGPGPARSAKKLCQTAWTNPSNRTGFALPWGAAAHHDRTSGSNRFKNSRIAACLPPWLARSDRRCPAHRASPPPFSVRVDAGAAALPVDPIPCFTRPRRGHPIRRPAQAQCPSTYRQPELDIN